MIDLSILLSLICLDFFMFKAPITIVTFIIMTLFAGYIFLWPVGFNPPKFIPLNSPALMGVLEPQPISERMLTIKTGMGPEDVAFDSQGNLYTGIENGWIVRANGLLQQAENWVNTGGRPLGLGFNSKGHLIVADAIKGLLSIDAHKNITVLSSKIEGVPYNFIDDIAIDKNDVIYFVDSSSEYSIHEDYVFKTFLDGRPLGRLLAYYPKTNTVEVIRSNLFFPNGITMSHDESSVLVSEMMTYRILRIGIGGHNKGEYSVFLENLPGFPNNIQKSQANKQAYWLALSAPRNLDVENLQQNPFMRKILLRLPTSLLPAPKPINYGFVVQLDSQGNMVSSIQDPSGLHAFMLTSATEHKGHLYLGSIKDTGVKKMALKHHSKN
jgi:sugar lactone lactonase YvrE